MVIQAMLNHAEFVDGYAHWWRVRPSPQVDLPII